MKLLTVLAATAVAAAIAAALSISAGANQSAGGKAKKPATANPAGLVSCLRAHGLNPPADVSELKPWLLRQAGAVLHACRVDVGKPHGGPSAKQVTACLRSRGVQVPAGADGLALKTWIRDHSGDPRVRDALERC